MPTVRNIIKDALLTIGAIHPAEATQQELGDACLRELNRLIEDININDGLVYEVIRATGTFVGGQQDYTMGVGGNFNIARPNQIEMVSILTGSPATEIALSLLNETQWRDVSVKSVTSDFPTRVKIEYGYPFVTMSFWPIPTTNATVVIYYWRALAKVTGQNDDISLPQGYEALLVYNLALRMSPRLGIPLDPVVAKMASDSRAAIARINYQTEYRKLGDSALGGGLFRSLGHQTRGRVVDP